MTFRPSKWLLYAPVAALPLLAAWVINTGPLQRDILERASADLKSQGAGWARLGISGRDVEVAGDAASAEAIDAAVKAVAGTYGVRAVASGARVVAPPKVELPAPAVNKVEAEARTWW